MSSLDELPPDQRAVLSLLLRQGRSYEQMTSLLAIAESAVRSRAQLALTALGGEAPSDLTEDERERVGDYLLGQLGEAERIETLALLLDSPGARAWARRVSEQLAPIAKIQLPEVPPDEDAGPPVPTARPRPAPAPTAPEPAPATTARQRTAAPAPAASDEPPRRTPRRPSDGGGRGAVVLVAALALTIAAIVVFAVGAGGSSTPPPGPIPAGATASTASSATTTTGTSSTGTNVLGEIRLSPTTAGGHAAGAVAIISAGSGRELAFSATSLAAPGAGHYVLWLYDSSTHFQVLGEIQSVSHGSVSPVAVTLPADASSYHGVVLSLETSTAPTSPSTIVLQGTSSSPL